MKHLIENFKFLVIEAENQVKLTHGLLSEYNEGLLEKIASKDDYIDNLKTSIENACFSNIYAMRGESDHKKLNDIRSIHIICVNLERIADFCVNICRQLEFLSKKSFIQAYDYKTMFMEIRKGLSLISEVFAVRDLYGALNICRTEFYLDKLFKDNFSKMMEELKQGRNVTDLITVIFIFRYLERIGDSLLNIGEALIFAIIGDRIKIRQVDALEKTLSESGFEGSLTDIDFTSIWGSRSGCRISKVGDKRPSGFKAQGIFKEGITRKIKKEKENIEKWHKIYPGLTPRVFGYYEKFDTASMLVEFLNGCSMDQVVLTEKSDVIRNVFYILEQTIGEIWHKTKQTCRFQTDYMDQLRSRLPSILNVHKNLVKPFSRINELYISSSFELIDACSKIEKDIPAPFTVFIHGDFNTSNIVYNHQEQKVNYIDLYRSKQADYVQDASVFLISHFRLPVFDMELRERLNTVTLYFYEMFHNFAQKNQDNTFEIRMALALVRSLYTSTRFELNYKFAEDMFLRAHYLMEKIAAYNGKEWEKFRLPENILFY